MHYVVGYLVTESWISLLISSLLSLIILLLITTLWGVGKTCKLILKIVGKAIPMIYKALVWTVKSIIRLSKYIVRQYRLYHERRIIEANKGFIEC